MKVNNPLQKRISRIGTYNGSAIYYDYLQLKTNIVVGRKEGGSIFYITGLLNIKQIIELIKSYENSEPYHKS